MYALLKINLIINETLVSDVSFHEVLKGETLSVEHPATPFVSMSRPGNFEFRNFLHGVDMFELVSHHYKFSSLVNGFVALVRT